MLAHVLHLDSTGIDETCPLPAGHLEGHFVVTLELPGKGFDSSFGVMPKYEVQMVSTDLIDKLNAIWRVPVILLMTALLSTLSVVMSLFDGTGRLQHRCAKRWADFIFFVSRVSVDVNGLEKLDSRRGYVFAANHLSMFDHWAFLSHLPFQFRFFAKASLFRVPFLGWHLKRSGNIPVNFDNPRETIRTFEQVKEKLRDGLSFVIYPEGMRTWDGETTAFKRGAFLLARKAEAPIVPVTITGAHKRLQRGSMVIHPGTMGLQLHDAIEFEEYSQGDLKAVAEKVRQTILSTYSTGS